MSPSIDKMVKRCKVNWKSERSDTMNGHYARWQSFFVNDHAHFWSNLGRLNNLLAIMNISMFFLTGLVTKGYYYAFYALICLGIDVILPTSTFGERNPSAIRYRVTGSGVLPSRPASTSVQKRAKETGSLHKCHK